ncbi:hypothetical protein [Amycolatopsis sp. FDAARGOS 1241]|uniref:hypothetical protein n=1 Tax=Amycolatopsis sp. FDAARGOS 1241 TaxID=2778070 RepID=UPI001951AF52|nr:hypothetical protein [Amycolatopsis sp. FDAARGOS 1241]QRP47989.1 hypothetical protein I6J71_08930 [Amycolatopsis sp. FDAARGOS 1241]
MPDPSNEVTIPRVEYDLLVLDAGAWRLLNESPHVAELLAEWVEWAYRADVRESSNAIAELFRGSGYGVSYTELARRRAVSTRPALTPEEIRAQTDESWARVEEWITKRRAA